MARISKLIQPALIALALGLTACVGPDEGAIRTTSDAEISSVSQGLSVSPTIWIEGYELIPQDIRLVEMRFSGVELVFSALDEEHDDVVLPIDLMAFREGATSSSMSDLAVHLPAEGRYSVRMQARDATSEEQGDEASDFTCIGFCFDALIDPCVPRPFDSRLVDDSGDGPNPHPFDGGGDGGDGPSRPGGEGDPVAGGEKGDGPNPHPFDGGDDGGGDGTPPPSSGGDTDPAASMDETSSWPTLTFKSDDSFMLEMGEINVEGEQDTVSLTIDLASISATPHSVTVQPATPQLDLAEVHSVPELVDPEPAMHMHELQPDLTRDLHEDARRMNNRGRHIYE